MLIYLFRLLFLSFLLIPGLGLMPYFWDALIMKEAGLVNSDPGEGEEGTYVCGTCVFGVRLSYTQPPPSLLRFAKWGGW